MARRKGRLTIKEMHRLLRAGEVRLRSMRSIESKGKGKKGYNKNYIRDWFDFGVHER